MVKAVDSFQRNWLITEYRATFKKVSLEWLGGSLVNTTGKLPSRRATKLYTFLVLLNTQYDWLTVKPPSH